MAGNLAVRKTVVLGLGSTGLRVAEQLAEHLNWQYGSFEKAAWVRILVLETAQPASQLGDRVLWAGMSRDEYLPYLNNPRTTGAEFDFFGWHDGPTLRDIDNPSDGAGNCRMLGRVCLFHPRNYENLRRRVTADLSFLQNLTPQKIADALGVPGLNVRVDEGGSVVYVVGTLCGGTCSGGAADLGYLIDVWSNHSVRRQAIFTLPHPTLGHSLGARYKKNAYFALKELNHFQLADTEWSQKLPGSDSPFVITARPYDILRVLMPAAGGDTDVRSLNAMIGQYLAAAVGPAGLEVAASDVDATAQMVGAESIGFMRPLFSTMGVAALEYPGEHIQRACTSRLLATAFSRWCAFRTDSPDLGSLFSSVGGWDFDRYVQELQLGVEVLSPTPFQQLLKPAADGNPPRVEQLRKLLREIGDRLTALELPSPSTAGASPGALPTLVQLVTANHARLLQRSRSDLDRFLEQRLLSGPNGAGGPGFVGAAVRQAVKELEGWSDSVQDQVAAIRQDAETFRSMLEQRLDAIEHLEGNLLVWNKRERLRHAWEEATGQLYQYLEAELRTHTLALVQRRSLAREMADHLRRASVLLLRRLDQIQVSFSQEAMSLERSWRDLATQSPSVNGKAYFEPEPPAARGTVTEEYFKLISLARWPDEPTAGWDEAGKEAAAAAAVIAAMEGLRSELTRDDGQSAFDPRPGVQSAREMIPRSVLSAAEMRARSFFEPLRSIFHIAERSTDTDIDTVVQASEPKLGVSAAQVSEQLAGVRGANPMLSYLAFMDTASGGADAKPALARVELRVRNSVQLRRGGVTDSDDPFRLLLLREKHGFTLGQMEGVVKSNRYDNHALQANEGCMDFKFWHTRRDVDWVDPLIPPAQVEGTEEAWLIGALLGRPSDPAVAWLPATAGEIEPTGWYQLVSGEFYVFYAEGVDASERGAMLPLAFNAAIAKLLSPDYVQLRRTLGMRFASYCDQHSPAHAVRILDQALRSLVIFGLGELDARRSERILRRAYRRNEQLTRAFFEFKTQNLRNPAEFAHLWRIQGTPIESRASEQYPSDGYYCPTCNYLLGGKLERLMEEHFLCPRCNTGQRYWP